MNTTKRFCLGLLSSLLFAIGFAQAAEHLDPVSRDAATTKRALADAAPNCDACSVTDASPNCDLCDIDAS